MNRFICIHGHFYQPPREDPWLKKVEGQESAAPYHDWNARITAECYAPNAQAEILDEDEEITGYLNNYAWISFNFGPTLFSWMEKCAPEVYKAVLEADRESKKRFGGHGSAIAQGYNHVIMPLANARDKETQVVWGIKDFQYRFNRYPEGMWLPETAVNLETLEVLARHEIKFTVLSPSQVRRVRPIGGAPWQDIEPEKLVTSRPYLCRLPSGKEIALFFYNARLASEVAFSPLLNSPKNFTQFLLKAFRPEDPDPQLVHLANDGETYGHHHRLGHQSLAYMIHYIESNALGEFTNYAQFLKMFPPAHEVQIKEDSSWSCYHGVERWRAHCGCRIDIRSDWNQHWRRSLREALDWLRDSLGVAYEEGMSQVSSDPWALRNRYIDIVLDDSPGNVSKFWKESRCSYKGASDKARIFKLLEMQRQAMLMYTSCGWFFDDISGIESVQNLRYAARAIELAREACALDLEEEFTRRLEMSKSNRPEMRDGKRVFETLVKRNQQLASVK